MLNVQRRCLVLFNHLPGDFSFSLKWQVPCSAKHVKGTVA